MAGSFADISKPAPTSAALNCPKCGSAITLRTPGLTASVVCPSCTSVLDTTNPTLKILVEGTKKLQQIKPLIPLGARGQLMGKEWEVTGFMQRHAADPKYTWREYLLFNPWYGFAWLVEENGHWNLVRTTMRLPSLNTPETEASWNGEAYKIFQRGQAKVQFVLGEFYWRVKTGDVTSTADYIAPPNILSREQDGNEFTWSQGSYVQPPEVKQAFNLEGELPAPQDVFLNQPPRIANFGKVVRAFFIAIGMLVAAQMYVTVSSPSEVVYQSQWRYDAADSTTRYFEGQPFDIKTDLNNVELRVASQNLNNNWLETELVLENVESGERYVMPQGLEFYSGRDSDGDWTEGSRGNDGLINMVPAGKYRLTAELAAKAPDLAYDTLQLSVVRGTAVWSNFLFALIPLGLLFVVLNWINAAFEMQRWQYSEYSPYATSSSDDDDDDSDDDSDSSSDDD
jgi:hypothetical protein